MRKLLLTTAGFITLTIVLASYLLTATSRTDNLGDMAHARQIEQGALIYHTHCASCHGEFGRAELCRNDQGQQIGCRGLPLNRLELICGESSPRLEQVNWQGSRSGYISQVTFIGRSQNGMPAFGQGNGGPLQDQQIDSVVAFVFKLDRATICTAHAPTREPIVWPAPSGEDLPAGNHETGEELFSITYGCAACHGDPDIRDSAATGPWVGDFVKLAIIETSWHDELLIRDHIIESILYPNASISTNCPTGPCTGPPSAMPDNFARRLSFQDLADLISYILPNGIVNAKAYLYHHKGTLLPSDNPLFTETKPPLDHPLDFHKSAGHIANDRPPSCLNPANYHLEPACSYLDPFSAK